MPTLPRFGPRQEYKFDNNTFVTYTLSITPLFRKYLFQIGNKERRPLSSLDKGIRILKLLGEPPYEYGLKEISENLDMGRSGAFKLLDALRAEHVVIQDRSTKKYHLGPVVLRLGRVYGQLKGLEELADPILAYIHRSSGETTYLTLWEGDRAFPAYKKSTSEGIYGYNDFIGKSIPVNSGASAMALCAFQGGEKIAALLGQAELPKRTPLTETDPERLTALYETIRQKGYAFEDRTFSLEHVSLAVPVFDRNGEVWSCLCLSAATERATEERITQWLQLLKDGAEELSLKLQFRR